MLNMAGYFFSIRWVASPPSSRICQVSKCIYTTLTSLTSACIPPLHHWHQYGHHFYITDINKYTTLTSLTSTWTPLLHHWHQHIYHSYITDINIYIHKHTTLTLLTSTCIPLIHHWHRNVHHSQSCITDINMYTTLTSLTINIYITPSYSSKNNWHCDIKI